MRVSLPPVITNIGPALIEQAALHTDGVTPPSPSYYLLRVRHQVKAIGGAAVLLYELSRPRAVLAA